MAESIAKTFFPALAAKLEKRKQATRDTPLSNADINTLLEMHFNGEPLFPSIEVFYSEEFKNALAQGISGDELDRITRFRPPADEELNMLFCDVHIRDDKFTYTGSNQSDG